MGGAARWHGEVREVGKGSELEQLRERPADWNARSATTAGSGRGGKARSSIVNVDGGARGNPGPAAIGAVVATPDGEILEERGETIGRATNNVAEYRALLLGIERAAELGATELELVGDSELVVKQVRGEYRVKDAGLRPLHRPAQQALSDFADWSIRHVQREQNAEARPARQRGARRRA